MKERVIIGFVIIMIILLGVLTLVFTTNKYDMIEAKGKASLIIWAILIVPSLIGYLYCKHKVYKS